MASAFHNAATRYGLLLRLSCGGCSDHGEAGRNRKHAGVPSAPAFDMVRHVGFARAGARAM
eukprot:7865687-Alexandrium_andersonii.AAC.1